MEKKEKGHKRLTIAELRNCKGFENYSDEQAETTIKSLEKLSILFYGLYMKHKQKEQKLAQLKTENAQVQKNISTRKTKKGITNEGENEREPESGKRNAA